MIVRLNVRHCDWTCGARTILRSIVRMLVRFIGGIYIYISTVYDLLFIYSFIYKKKKKFIIKYFNVLLIRLKSTIRASGVIYYEHGKLKLINRAMIVKRCTIT